MNSSWHLAQINVATALHPLDDQRMSSFVEQLDDVNAMADDSPGFIWRLQSDSGNAVDIRFGDDPMLIVNMSVWQSIEALYEFAYKTAHRQLLVDRRQWFRRPENAYQALWWVAVGHQPTVDEGMQRLALLQTSGPTEGAFKFRTHFPPPDQSGTPRDLNPESYCSGWK